MSNIRVKKLSPNAVLPTYGTNEAAGADLYACLEETVSIAPGQTCWVGTGIALEVPKGCAGLIYARSSLGVKRGLAPANKVGVIDSDYRGEIRVVLLNQIINESSIIIAAAKQGQGLFLRQMVFQCKRRVILNLISAFHRHQSSLNEDQSVSLLFILYAYGKLCNSRLSDHMNVRLIRFVIYCKGAISGPSAYISLKPWLIRFDPPVTFSLDCH